MKTHLLNTTALIDFSKRREPAYSKLLAWIDKGDTLAVGAISVAGSYAGLNPGEAGEWEAFIAALSYWPIGVAEAMRAGQDRYAFARVGKTITVTDAQIAAGARKHQAVLVTNNSKDYPMPDVQLLPLDGRERLIGIGTSDHQPVADRDNTRNSPEDVPVPSAVFSIYQLPQGNIDD